VGGRLGPTALAPIKSVMRPDWTNQSQSKSFAPVSGWLGERYGARRLMLVGGLLYGGSMGLLGLVRQPWHFLLAFSLLLSLTQSICLVLLIAAVSGWFRRRLGLATGILCKPRHDLLATSVHVS
jgi:MFS family permease